MRCFVGRVLVHLHSSPKDKPVLAIVKDYESRIRGRGISVLIHQEKNRENYEKKLSETGGILVIMDERGKQLTSVEFADWLKSAKLDFEQTNIAVGPSEGFSEELKTSSKHSFSLSSLTLTHEMAAAVLLEQLYRATEINRGSPYHRE